MSCRTPYRLLILLLASIGAFASVSLVPQSANAQDDPCLTELADKPEALADYDLLVGEYLDAADAGDSARQIATLDALWDVCAANLRLVVFRGDALRANGDCSGAVSEYMWVIDNAEAWRDRTNGDDALQRALQAMEEMGDSCVAQVQVRCADQPGVEVRIGTRPPQPCPATVEVAAGSYDVVVTGPSLQPFSKNYTFGVGNNFIELEALATLHNAGTLTFACDEAGTELTIGFERFACPATRTFSAGPLAYVAVTRSGQTIEGEVEVLAGQTSTIVVTAKAQENSGTLSVTCVPTNAELTVTGGGLIEAFEGRCPVSMQLPPGGYTVSARATGTPASTRTVKVSRGQNAELHLALDPPKPPKLLLRAMGGIGLLSTHHNQNLDLIEQNEGPSPTGVGLIGAIIPINQANVTADLLLFLRASYGDEFGLLGAFVYRWVIPSSFLRIGFGVGFSWGTTGTPACVPGGGGDCPADDPSYIAKEVTSAFGYMLELSVDVHIAGPLWLVIGGEYILPIGGGNSPVLDGLAGISYAF